MCMQKRPLFDQLSVWAILKATGVLACVLLAIWAFATADSHTTHAQPAFVTYYVDSKIGDDANSCEDAQTPEAPKQTVSGVLACNPGAGETVKFRGTFSETIQPPASGEVLYDVQDISHVTGSQIVFTGELQDIVPDVDYVTIYGSRRGNSGAFRVIAAEGSTITVDASALPAGEFLEEHESDPGDLQAAVLRPVHYTAWDIENPPLWYTDQQTFHSIDRRVIMVSYIHSDSIGGDQGVYVWPAFEIDGTVGGNADFHIFDHLDIQHAEAGIATEFRDFQSNYSIIQHSHLHNMGYAGNASDEIIYWGNAYHPDRHHDYCQIMYNKVGPHNSYPVSQEASNRFTGDGIEIKPSAHNCTIFGNEIVGTHAINGCDDAPIRIAGINAFVSNNYVHDISPQPGNLKGCGISLIDRLDLGENGGAEGTIVVNNIVANVRNVGIRVLDSDNVQILNNVVYNVVPPTDCEFCVEETFGIMVQNYEDTTENVVIRNNIVHSAPTGIGRWPWSRDFSFSITSDHNIVFNTEVPFSNGIPQSDTDSTDDPGLIDPPGGDFSIDLKSAAKDSGIEMGDVFVIDNHTAQNPGWPALTAMTVRSQPWDIGVYEHPTAPLVEEEKDDRVLRVLLAVIGGVLVLIGGLVVLALRRRQRTA